MAMERLDEIVAPREGDLRGGSAGPHNGEAKVSQ